MTHFLGLALRVAALSTIIIVGGLLAGLPTAGAQSADQHRFNIPAQDLGKALTLLGEQAEREIVFSADITRGKRSVAVKGDFTAREALDKVLAGSGLTYRLPPSGPVVVELPSDPVGARESSAPGDPRTASTTAESEKTDQLADIVVTAQKRTESVSKVPLSISAISAGDLLHEHITNFSDLSQAVPNVSFTTQGGPGLSTIEIRGISSQAGTAAIGVYLDDVSLTTRNLYSQGTAEPRFFDLDRVEALRGPQGTLYGGGTLGGVIRFIEKKPDLTHFDVSASAEVSGTHHGGTNYNTEAVLNLPLVDGKLALRLGGQKGHDSGYIDQVNAADLSVIAKGINGNQWTVGKAALKWQITDAWSVTPAVFYQKIESDDTDAYFELVPYNQPHAGAPLAALQTTKTEREPATDKLTIPSLTVEGDLGFADLSAVGSVYERDFARIQDGTIVNVPYLASLFPTGSAVANGINGLNSIIDLTTKQKQTSLELKLASKPYAPDTGLPISWVAGAFYVNSTTEVFDNEPVIGISTLFNQRGLNINDPNVFPGSFPGAWTVGDSSYYSHRYYHPSQRALFGELNYYVRSDVHVTLGLRYESAKETFRRDGNYYYTSCGLPDALGDQQTCPLQYSPPAASFKATTPRVALTWDIDDLNLLYAGASKGYREGSFNIPVPLYGPPPAAGSLSDLYNLGLCNGTAAGCKSVIPSSFKPDSLWSYEIGSKSRLFGNRVSINTSLFLLKWNNTQQDIFLVQSFYQFESNAGAVESYGAEIEVKARPIRDLTLTLSGGYNHATFSDDVPALGSSNGVLNVSKGTKVPGVPDYNALLGAGYTYSYSGAVAGFVRGDARFVGKSQGTFVIGAPDYSRPSYATSDASTGLTFGAIEVSLFAKNLNNNQKILQRPNIQTVIEAYTMRPRTIGLNFNYRFADR